MTEIATRRWAGGMPGRLAVRRTRPQRQLSDRVHTDGDAFTREHEWTIATDTGLFGFGARVYRDPPFGQRVAVARLSEPPSSPGSRRSR